MKTENCGAHRCWQWTDVEPSGESGLMSIALHPQFASNHFFYLSYAYKGDGQRVRVVRYTETPKRR